MNDICQEYLDHFVVIYLYDILVFSPSIEEHTRQVLLVCAKLQDQDYLPKERNVSLFVLPLSRSQGLEPKRMGCFRSIGGLFMCRFVRFMYILIDRVYINPFPFPFSKYPLPFIS